MDYNMESICSECSKTGDYVKEFYKMDGRIICNECLDRFRNEHIVNSLKSKIMPPKDFMKLLDERVIGQESAKRTLSVAVYSHLNRLCNMEYLKETGKPFEKNNIIMTGPSGTGKTLLAKTMADILGIPFVIFNATTLSETGYVGADVESILVRLLKAADGDVKKAECGIVFIDEIDKKSMKAENTSITRDVSGEGVQDALLKIIEGCVVGVPQTEGRIHPQQQLTDMDTSNILFICGGAFEGVEKIIRKRLGINDMTSKQIGFSREKTISIEEKEINQFIRDKVSQEDLIKYGLKKEFLGRLPVICNLNPLTKEDMLNIIKNKHGILEEYKTQFEIMGKKLVFDENGLDSIADMVVTKQFGARSLRDIFNSIMQDVIFDCVSKEDEVIVITKNMMDEAMMKYLPEYGKAMFVLESLERQYFRKDKSINFKLSNKERIAKKVIENDISFDSLGEIVDIEYIKFVKENKERVA